MPQRSCETPAAPQLPHAGEPSTHVLLRALGREQHSECKRPQRQPIWGFPCLLRRYHRFVRWYVVQWREGPPASDSMTDHRPLCASHSRPVGRRGRREANLSTAIAAPEIDDVIPHGRPVGSKTALSKSRPAPWAFFNL